METTVEEVDSSSNQFGAKVEDEFSGERISSDGIGVTEMGCQPESDAIPAPLVSKTETECRDNSEMEDKGENSTELPIMSALIIEEDQTPSESNVDSILETEVPVAENQIGESLITDVGQTAGFNMDNCGDVTIEPHCCSPGSPPLRLYKGDDVVILTSSKLKSEVPLVPKTENLPNVDSNRTDSIDKSIDAKKSDYPVRSAEGNFKGGCTEVRTEEASSLAEKKSLPLSEAVNLGLLSCARLEIDNCISLPRKDDCVEAEKIESPCPGEASTVSSSVADENSQSGKDFKFLKPFPVKPTAALQGGKGHSASLEENRECSPAPSKMSSLMGQKIAIGSEPKDFIMDAENNIKSEIPTMNDGEEAEDYMGHASNLTIELHNSAPDSPPLKLSKGDDVVILTSTKLKKSDVPVVSEKVELPKVDTNGVGGKKRSDRVRTPHPSLKNERNEDKSLPHATQESMERDQVVDINNSQGQEMFTSSKEFVHATNPTEWDMLINRGNRIPETNRWERQSLYRKFDPLLISNDEYEKNATARPLFSEPALSGTNTPVSHRKKLAGKQQSQSLERPHRQKSQARVKIGNLISINTPPEQTRTTVSVAPPGVETDLSGLGVPLPETRTDTMSPSLSSDCVDMDVADTQRMVKNALGAQEEQFLGQLNDKERNIHELEQSLAKLELQVQEQSGTSRVLIEYEKTMSSYIQQVEDLKATLQQVDQDKLSIIRDRDQASEDLKNVERAFSDVHRKYERAKSTLENFKLNEDILIKRNQDLQIKLDNVHRKMDALKDEAKSQIERIHQDYESRLQSVDAENIKLRALLRKTEMKTQTLENDLEQKQKENAQLSALCDELISGPVGK